MFSHPLKKTLLILGATAGISTALFAGQLDNFSELDLAPNSHFSPSTLESTGTFDEVYSDNLYMEIYTGSISSRGKTFGTVYSTGKWTMPGMEDFNMPSSWCGFVSSSMTATDSGGLASQYNAITGTGYDGSSDYLIFYGDCGGLGINAKSGEGVKTIGMCSDAPIEGLWVTNTCYAYYSMKDGDSYQAAFTDDDYFKLVITGYDDALNELGTLDFFLAQGTDILDEWAYVDILSAMGADVTVLSFNFESTGGAVPPSGNFDVPGYFALGGVLTAVPEPSACAGLMGTAVFALAFARRRK